MINVAENFVEKIKKMTNDELDKELLSHDINDIGRHIILEEKTRRQLKRPHWTVVPTFILVLLTLIITILLNYEKIVSVFNSWFGRQ